MEKSIRKQYKSNLLLAAIFFIGFFMIGMLPWILYGDGFWNQNTFLEVVGSILGFILFVIGIVYLYLNIFSFKPKLLFPNTVQGINIVLLLFVVDTLLLIEESVFSPETSIWLFTTIGLYIILSNLFVFYKYKNNNSEDFRKMKSYIQNLDNLKYDQKEVAFLSHYILIGMIAVVITGDFNEVSDYILVFLFNGFFVYKYLKMAKENKNKAIIGSAFSALLYAFTIFMYITFNSFTNNHVVIKSLLFVLPLIHYIPIITKAYYSMILKELAKS